MAIESKMAISIQEKATSVTSFFHNKLQKIIYNSFSFLTDKFNAYSQRWLEDELMTKEEVLHLQENIMICFLRNIQIDCYKKAKTQ